MKPLHLTLLAVVGFGLATMEASAETWPTKPLRAIVPVGAGSTTDIIPRVVFEQLSATARPEHRRGEPRRRRGHNRLRVRRQGGSRWLHDPRPRLRAHDLAVALSQPRLRSGARFCCCRPTRDLSQRPGRSAGQGLEDGRRFRHRRPRRSQVRSTSPRSASAAQPTERRAVSAQRGRGRRPRSVQGRR